jgi:hypothetical protein
MWKRLSFFSKEPPAEPAEQPQPPKGIPQRSLALNALVQQFRGEKKYHVLDLGPADGPTIEFFSRFRCRLYIEDLYDTLNSFDYFSPEDGFDYDVVFRYLLPFPRELKFDFILAWDLFNYFDKDVLGSLTAHLTKHCRRGTILLCQIATQHHIPELPYRIRIVDDETIEYIPQSEVMKEAPRYEVGDLARLLPGFRSLSSFVLRNGYREYLFFFD